MSSLNPAPFIVENQRKKTMKRKKEKVSALLKELRGSDDDDEPQEKQQELLPPPQIQPSTEDDDDDSMDLEKIQRQREHIPEPSNQEHVETSHTPFEGYTNVSHPMFYRGVEDNREKMMEKLNHLIHLLEEQQDEKTNITEEFILYCFLGIFVIFTVDSFTKAAKYIR